MDGIRHFALCLLSLPNSLDLKSSLLSCATVIRFIVLLQFEVNEVSCWIL